MCSQHDDLSRLERPILRVLIAALRRTGCCQIVDLCSGGGAPMLSPQKALTAEGLEMHITLTDKFPNLRALQRAQETHKGVCFVPVSVDAWQHAVSQPRLLRRR